MNVRLDILLIFFLAQLVTRICFQKLTSANSRSSSNFYFPRQLWKIYLPPPLSTFPIIEITIAYLVPFSHIFDTLQTLKILALPPSFLFTRSGGKTAVRSSAEGKVFAQTFYIIQP